MSAVASTGSGPMANNNLKFGNIQGVTTTPLSLTPHHPSHLPNPTHSLAQGPGGMSVSVGPLHVANRGTEQPLGQTTIFPPNPNVSTSNNLSTSSRRPPDSPDPDRSETVIAELEEKLARLKQEESELPKQRVSKVDLLHAIRDSETKLRRAEALLEDLTERAKQHEQRQARLKARERERTQRAALRAEAAAKNPTDHSSSSTSSSSSSGVGMGMGMEQQPTTTTTVREVVETTPSSLPLPMVPAMATTVIMRELSSEDPVVDPDDPDPADNLQDEDDRGLYLALPADVTSLVWADRKENEEKTEKDRKRQKKDRERQRNKNKSDERTRNASLRERKQTNKTPAQIRKNK
jgi:hypothetical protein